MGGGSGARGRAAQHYTTATAVRQYFNQKFLRNGAKGIRESRFQRAFSLLWLFVADPFGNKPPFNPFINLVETGIGVCHLVPI